MEACLAPSRVERRSKVRFPVRLKVRYRCLDHHRFAAGEGQTLDMSSSSLLVMCRQAVEPGSRVEVVIDWPSQLDFRIPLQLIVIGRVVRAGGGTFAVEFAQHQFRTARSKPLRKPIMFQASA